MAPNTIGSLVFVGVAITVNGSSRRNCSYDYFRIKLSRLVLKVLQRLKVNVRIEIIENIYEVWELTRYINQLSWIASKLEVSHDVLTLRIFMWRFQRAAIPGK